MSESKFKWVIVYDNGTSEEYVGTESDLWYDLLNKERGYYIISVVRNGFNW